MKPLTFKVWVDPKGKYYTRKRYYRVFLFPRERDMYRFADSLRSDLQLGYLEHNYGGLTIGFVDPDPKDPRLVGVILLGGRHCHMAGVVSHEMAHAAHYIILPLLNSKRRGIRIFPDEKVAWIQGEFVRQFWSQWWRLHDKGHIKKVKGLRVA